MSTDEAGKGRPVAQPGSAEAPLSPTSASPPRWTPPWARWSSSFGTAQIGRGASGQSQPTWVTNMATTTTSVQPSTCSSHLE